MHVYVELEKVNPMRIVVRKVINTFIEIRFLIRSLIGGLAVKTFIIHALK